MLAASVPTLLLELSRLNFVLTLRLAELSKLACRCNTFRVAVLKEAVLSPCCPAAYSTQHTHAFVCGGVGGGGGGVCVRVCVGGDASLDCADKATCTKRVY